VVVKPLKRQQPRTRGRARVGVDARNICRANPHPNLPPDRGKELLGTYEYSGVHSKEASKLITIDQFIKTPVLVRLAPS
jgi:hypothetical protein